QPFWMTSILALAALVALPAFAAGKRFQDDDASREKDEPTTWLKDYDKLVEGKEADWVFFDGYSAGSYKSVAVKEFSATEKDKEARHAAEYGKEYAEQWIQESKKLGWEVVSGGKADLTIEGNVAHAWEPSGAARFWGGWYANPGAVQELIGKDSSGKIVFQIRHKSRGSTVKDAIENGLEDVVKSLEKGK
ncbi:MAG: hypothetical protein KBB14_19070, partial [Thermoanaerobaculia bacterium]|nr:hypothetical protein [Thermoanaerobaculia bacterium]